MDIDHVNLENPLMKLMLSNFNSYAEYSSNDGFHILGRYNLEELPLHYDDTKKRKVLNSEFYQKDSKLGIELYLGGTTNRFATFTGIAVNNLCLTDCTDTVLTILDKEM